MDPDQGELFGRVGPVNHHIDGDLGIVRRGKSHKGHHIVRNILMEALPYLNIFMTESLTEAEVAELEALQLEITHGNIEILSKTVGGQVRGPHAVRLVNQACRPGLSGQINIGLNGGVRYGQDSQAPGVQDRRKDRHGGDPGQINIGLKAEIKHMLGFDKTVVSQQLRNPHHNHVAGFGHRLLQGKRSPGAVLAMASSPTYDLNNVRDPSSLLGSKMVEYVTNANGYQSIFSTVAPPALVILFTIWGS